MILISPSKTQDFSEEAPITSGVKPEFIKETKSLHKILKSYSSTRLSKLMKVSDKLAELNYERFQKWSSAFSKQTINKLGEYNFKQSIFAFRGDVYSAFSDSTFSKGEINYMQDNLLILSGFYGLLKPLTFIRPYRLEMGTRINFSIKKTEYSNLYEYWRSILTASLAKSLKSKELIINLASVEYSRVINFSEIENKKIDIKFQNMKNGKPKTIGIYAKQQRGRMSVWIIKNKVESIAGLKKYKNDGYVYSKKLSSDDELVFLKK